MFGAWVQAAERAILSQHCKKQAGRSRSQGPALSVEVVQRPEHVRSQPLADSIASWWAGAR
eukprot:115690-Pyramimonas_sp.AAC.1